MRPEKKHFILHTNKSCKIDRVTCLDIKRNNDKIHKKLFGMIVSSVAKRFPHQPAPKYVPTHPRFMLKIARNRNAKVPNWAPLIDKLAKLPS